MIGSGDDAVELQALKTAAVQRLTEGQQTLEPDVGDTDISGVTLEIAPSRMAHLWHGLCSAYFRVGSDRAADRDEVFRDLVLAPMIEQTNKAASLRCRPRPG